MKVFVWDYVSQASDRYHPDGGVVVIAPDEPTARDRANALEGCAIKPDEMPCRVIECGDAEQPGVFIFPDAGCC